MRIGATELLVVLIVALLLIGPDKLPVFAKKFGEALAVFKKAASEATKDIQESVVEPLNEAQKPLREAVEPLEETRREVRGQVQGLQRSLNNIGKTKPAEKKAAEEYKGDHSQAAVTENGVPGIQAAAEVKQEETAGEEAPAEMEEEEAV